MDQVANFNDLDKDAKRATSEKLMANISQHLQKSKKVASGYIFLDFDEFDFGG